jgi:hypothetical protein
VTVAPLPSVVVRLRVAPLALAPAPALTLGRSSARWTRNWAAAEAMLAAATLRSRLLASACSISAWSLGSRKMSR